MTMNPQNIAEEIASRVNCYHIADWAEQLAAHLAVAPTLLLPETPALRHVPLLGRKGVVLVFRYPQAEQHSRSDPQKWALEDVTFFPQEHVEHGRWPYSLPWGLDATGESPDSARSKLSNDTAGGDARDIAAGDRRITYFLSDARAVELTFGPGMRGLERISVSRLGVAMPEAYFKQESPNSFT